MTTEERKAVFLDLYELYLEGDLEEETMMWMKENERFFKKQAEEAARLEMAPPNEHKDDSAQVRHMKIYVYTLYAAFVLLSIWMTVWFYF